LPSQAHHACSTGGPIQSGSAMACSRLIGVEPAVTGAAVGAGACANALADSSRAADRGNRRGIGTIPATNLAQGSSACAAADRPAVMGGGTTTDGAKPAARTMAGAAHPRVPRRVCVDELLQSPLLLSRIQ